MDCCPFLRASSCDLATGLAGKVSPATSDACNFCSGLPDSRSINQVTLSLAIVAADQNRSRRLQADYRYLVPVLPSAKPSAQLTAITAGTGPGSQLWRLLESLGIRHTATCPCLQMAERMNAWGPAGCRLARAEIVDQMRTNAKQYGWGTVAKAAAAAIRIGLAWRLDLADVYGSLLDEAIRRAEASDALPILSPQA